MERGIVPYRFGAPVGPPFFCDREDELKVLMERMRSGVHAFVLSPRRYGKTSLLRRAQDQLGKEGVAVGYANLLVCTTETEVAGAVLSAVVGSATSRLARARRSLAEILRGLRMAPSVSFDAEGSVKLSFEAPVGRRAWSTLLDDARDLLLALGGEQGAALILDEFQVVASVGPRGMGGAFKAFADAVTSASLVFSGSHLSIMESLTAKRGSPLYGMGERFVLDVIPAAKIVPYLQRRAKAVGRTMSAQVGALIYERSGAVPHYVQYLAQAAVEQTGPGEAVSEDSVEAGLDAVVDRQISDFADRVESLAASQQRILRALATQPTGRVYSRAFLESVDVSNANGVTQALRVLEGRELVQRRGGTWTVVDPFLAYWLARI